MSLGVYYRLSSAQINNKIKLEDCQGSLKKRLCLPGEIRESFLQKVTLNTALENKNNTFLKNTFKIGRWCGVNRGEDGHSG
jgi:hypothetical protein